MTADPPIHITRSHDGFNGCLGDELVAYAVPVRGSLQWQVLRCDFDEQTETVANLAAAKARLHEIAREVADARALLRGGGI
jgi:hypothetical protein